MNASQKGAKDRGVLFLIGSPLQALSAVEAQGYFGEQCEHCHVFVVPSRTERAAIQVERCLVRGKWRSVRALPGGDDPSDLVIWRRMLDAFVRENGVPKRLYLGDFRNMLGVHLARKYHPEVVVLDDGSALHRFVADRAGEHRATGQKARRGVPSWIKPLARRLRYGIRSGPLPPATLFTIYERLTPAPQDQLVVNRFERLRAAVQLVRRDGEVFIIGGCLTELRLVHPEFYDAQICWIAKRTRGKKVSYIPHRREDPARYNTYKSRFDFEVIDTDVPVELLILERGWAPQEIFGFYSTALDTLHLLTADCESSIVSLRIPPAAIRTPMDIPFIDSVYHYFEGYRNRFKIEISSDLEREPW